MVLVFKEMQMNFVKSKDASIHITDGKVTGVLGP
jgi:ABC-type Na+ transport system ATPase subunit NatA